MATDIDPVGIMVTLLSDEWNDSNTDNATKEISKIYEIPKVQNLTNKDYILLYALPQNSQAIGIGNDTYANVTDTLKIDIRVSGTSDTHARKVLTEVLRILHSNRLNVPNYCELNPFGELVDLSDKTRKIYRYVKTVQLIDYSRDMTA